MPSSACCLHFRGLLTALEVNARFLHASGMQAKPPVVDTYHAVFSMWRTVPHRLPFLEDIVRPFRSGVISIPLAVDAQHAILNMLLAVQCGLFPLEVEVRLRPTRLM